MQRLHHELLAATLMIYCSNCKKSACSQKRGSMSYKDLCTFPAISKQSHSFFSWKHAVIEKFRIQISWKQKFRTSRSGKVQNAHKQHGAQGAFTQQSAIPWHTCCMDKTAESDQSSSLVNNTSNKICQTKNNREEWS